MAWSQSGLQRLQTCSLELLQYLDGRGGKEITLRGVTGQNLLDEPSDV